MYLTDYFSIDKPVLNMSSLQENIYFLTNDLHIIKFDKSSQSFTNDIALSLDNYDKVQSFTIDKKGNYLLNYRTVTDDSYINWLIKYDFNGNPIYECNLTDILYNLNIHDTYYFEDIAIDSDNYIYLRLGSDGVLVLNAEGNFIAIEALPDNLKINRLTATQDGKVFVSSEQELFELKHDNGFVLSQSLIVSGNELSYCGEDKLLINFNGTLYLQDIKKKQQNILLSWMNCGIDTVEIMSFFADEEDAIYVLLKNLENLSANELAIVKRCDKEALTTDINILTVGTFYSGPKLQQAVAAYNKEHRDCHVEVIEYYERFLDPNGTNYQDSMTRFHLDIASGNCPDIINLAHEEIEKYNTDALFEDLNPYLENSPLLSYDNNLLENYTYGKRLIALPNSIGLRTIIGKSSLLKSSSWTIEEMMDFLQQNNDNNLFQVNSIQLLEYFYLANPDFFEMAICDDQSTERLILIDIVELCKQKGQNYVPYSPYINIYSNPKEAELYEVIIRNASEINVFNQLLGSNRLNYIGFPTENSNSRNCIIELDGCYTILKNCKQKDLAWDFLCTLFTNTQPITLYNLFSGFPAESNSRALYLKYAMDGQEILNKDYNTSKDRPYIMIGENNVRYYIPSAEDVQTFEELVEHSFYPKKNEIWMILAEEVEGYFKDIKSLDNTLDVIQNRVNLYLNER